MFAVMISLVILFQQGQKPEQILKEIFPGSSIEVKNFTLSEEQIEKVEKLSGTKMNTRLASFYIVKQNDKVMAYACVDIHIVRTHPEAVLYILTSDGAIDLIKILSFKEPPEYIADENWLKYFKGKKLDKDILRLRKDIPNMSGATLTSKAITESSRRILALWKVIFGVR